MKKGVLRRKIAGFTLAELLVVITVSAILATIGFLSLSGYRKDAEETRTKANLRSMYSAISTESVSVGRSPRYYVRHDPNMALSGGAVIVFDGFPVALAGGEWDMPGTNYSAGNPHYEKLKLDSEKFRTSFDSIPWGTFGMILRNLGIRTVSADPYVADPSGTLVGAADFTDSSGYKPRVRSYLQIGALSTNGISYVTGDYPEPPDESAASGLIRDVQNPSGTGALVDGAPIGAPAPCVPGTVSDYSVGPLESGGFQNVARAIENGSVNAVARCAYGTVRIELESVSCEENYVRGAGYSCVRDTCAWTFPEHAESNGEPGTSSWSFSESPGVCKFRCVNGYSWDGAACRADCAIPVSSDHLWNAYALALVHSISHGQTLASSGTHAFWLAPANGTLRADFEFSCVDGTASKTSASISGSCQENYSWNGDFSHPSCQAQTRTADCESLPSAAEWNSVPSITQNWNGTAWTPSTVGAFSASSSTSSCVFRCVSGYEWNGSACVATSCAAIKSAHPTSGDGTYQIDPDGNWPVAAFTATCDMNTGTGGWIVLNDALADYTKWTNCVSGYGTVSASGLWQVAANNGGGVSGVHGGCGIIWRNEKKIPFRHLQIKSFSAPANVSCGSVLFPNIKVNVFSSDSIPTSFSTGNHYPWWEPEGTNYVSKRSGSRSSGFPTSDLYDAGSSGTWSVHLGSGRYSSCWGAGSGVFMVR